MSIKERLRAFVADELEDTHWLVEKMSALMRKQQLVDFLWHAADPDEPLSAD